MEKCVLESYIMPFGVHQLYMVLSFIQLDFSNAHYACLLKL
jgi:hypothetical protein